MNATDLGETELEETTSSNLKTSRWALMLSESPIDLSYLRVYMLVNRRSCWRRSFINWLLRLGRESASPHSLSLQITRSTRSRACNLSLFKFFSSSEGECQWNPPSLVAVFSACRIQYVLQPLFSGKQPASNSPWHWRSQDDFCVAAFLLSHTSPLRL